MSHLVLGAVAYDQKVVPIWDGFLQYFCARDLPFDYVLFSNYERQVEAQIRGHIHVAWHSPLAWVQTMTPRKLRSRTQCSSSFTEPATSCSGRKPRPE